MLKKVKLKNSTAILLGIIFILIGLFLGFSDYLKTKKDKAFSEMNILLYESETPVNIVSNDEIEQKQETHKQEENIEIPSQEEDSSQQKQTVYDYIGILEIPKINIRRGFLSVDSKYNNVDYNVTVIRGSTFPDEENNNLILASHSGPCTVCYFKELYKLSLGDSAYVTYKGVKHFYKIVNIYEVKKDGTVEIYRDYTKNVLTLITCTRNTNDRQTVYILEEYATNS